jgi:hypothetical protein
MGLIAICRDGVTTPCNGDERPKGGPEQERGVRRIAE